MDMIIFSELYRITSENTISFTRSPAMQIPSFARGKNHDRLLGNPAAVAELQLILFLPLFPFFSSIGRTYSNILEHSLDQKRHKNVPI